MKAKAKKTVWHAAREAKKVEQVQPEIKQETDGVAPQIWKSYHQINNPGLYVMKNSEGLNVVRVQRIEDGLRVFYNIIGANSPIHVHADVMTISTYQAIAG